MTITFETCSPFGKILFIGTAIAFVVFLVSAVVIDHNEKVKWSGNKWMFYLLPLFYPKESISPDYVGWHPIYKLSGVVFFLGAILLFAGTSLGHVLAAS